MTNRIFLTVLALALLLTPASSRQLLVVRVAAGEDLQAAIDAARPGDTLALEPGARFTGNFVLPKRESTASTFVTIRTDGPALPKEGVRTSPAYSGRLAIIQSTNSDPALRTARGARGWRLENLEFRGTARGAGAIIALGDGGSAQKDLEDVPHHLVLDRVLVRGDAAHGQRRGIALNSGHTEIRNSYIADIKAIGADSQAIGGWNGPGPFVIENNYLEAAGENVLFGGGDPAIPGLIPSDIVVRGNLMSKPVAWREPIVPAPPQPRAARASAKGTLPAGTYTYRVVAERIAGPGVMAASAPAAVEVQVESAGGVLVEWDAVERAERYRVFRQPVSGAETSWTVTDPRFVDTGEGGTPGSPPAPAKWSVKNIFELKNARRVIVDGNILEYSWLAGQPGYAVVITPRNQDGRAPWSTVEDVTFTNNVIRHAGGGFNIMGVDDNHPSGRARGITIRNNLLYDLNGRRWGGQGDFLQLGDGPAGVVVEQNTVVHSGRIISAYGGGRGRHVEGFVFRGNLIRHNRYGVIGSNAASGLGTLSAYFPGAVFEANVIAGGDRARYPERNAFVSPKDFDELFVNAAAGNYRVKGAGGERRVTAGADIGAIEKALGSAIEPAAAHPSTRGQSP